MGKFDKFEAELREMVAEVGRLLAEEEIPSVRLDMEISGRVGGKLKVEFVIGREYESSNARGGSLELAVEEFVRRNRWEKSNEPTLIER